jgi:hypothetical protein
VAALSRLPRLPRRSSRRRSGLQQPAALPVLPRRHRRRSPVPMWDVRKRGLHIESQQIQKTRLSVEASVPNGPVPLKSQSCIAVRMFAPIQISYPGWWPVEREHRKCSVFLLLEASPLIQNSSQYFRTPHGVRARALSEPGTACPCTVVSHFGLTPHRTRARPDQSFIDMALADPVTAACFLSPENEHIFDIVVPREVGKLSDYPWVLCVVNSVFEGSRHQGNGKPSSE